MTSTVIQTCECLSKHWQDLVVRVSLIRLQQSEHGEHEPQQIRAGSNYNNGWVEDLLPGCRAGVPVKACVRPNSVHPLCARSVHFGQDGFPSNSS
jgi:hypothetical protein